MTELKFKQLLEKAIMQLKELDYKRDKNPRYVHIGIKNALMTIEDEMAHYTPRRKEVVEAKQQMSDLLR